MQMVKECRKFIDSLRPARTEWTNEEIMDVLLYYSSDRCSIRYSSIGIVSVYDKYGKFCFSFYDL